WNMGRIRGKNTAPEILVRSSLHRLGFRFRLHAKSLPGKPDIVLPKWKAVIFVNGCFWHRHRNCPQAYTPKSRVGFWKSKFAATVRRDAKKLRQLHRAGWQTFTIWECDLQKSNFHGKLNAIIKKMTTSSIASKLHDIGQGSVG